MSTREGDATLTPAQRRQQEQRQGITPPPDTRTRDKAMQEQPQAPQRRSTNEPKQQQEG